MIQTFDDMGSAGINRDVTPHALPLPSWSSIRNMRMRDGFAEKFRGHSAIYDPPTVKPYWLQPLTAASGRFWIYAGAAKIYAVSNTTHTNITRQTAGVDVDYTGGLNTWNGGVLSGIAVINNGVDDPQYWAGNTGTRCAALTAWPASTKCKSIRPFKNYLVAMNITKSSTNYPTMVKWSHAADPGTLPSSWDETDATKDAGEFDLSDDQSKLIDGMQLGDQFILYKESAIYAAQYIGPPYIFRFQKLTDAAGLLCPNGLVGYPGGHVFISQGDVMALTGAAPISILTGRMKKYFINNLDVVAYAQSFCAHNPLQNEVWVCYPKAGATYCNEAIVWNYITNTLSLRDLPNVIHGAAGVIDYTLGNSWDVDSDAWDADDLPWNAAEYTQSSQRLLLASNDTKLYLADYTLNFAGSPYTSSLEKIGMDLGDATKIKTITSIRPRIEAAPGTAITIRFGGAMDLNGGISWTAPITYTVGTDLRAHGFATGRYLAVRFENSAARAWRVKSFDLEFEVMSDY